MGCSFALASYLYCSTAIQLYLWATTDLGGFPASYSSSIPFLYSSCSEARAPGERIRPPFFSRRGSVWEYGRMCHYACIRGKLAVGLDAIVCTTEGRSILRSQLAMEGASVKAPALLSSWKSRTLHVMFIRFDQGSARARAAGGGNFTKE